MFISLLDSACVCVSRSVMSDSLWPHGLKPVRLLSPWEFSRQEYWSGVAIPFSRGSSWLKDQSRVSYGADSLPSEPRERPLDSA